MPLWLSKPLYEGLPYFYGTAGLALLVASAYLDYRYWPAASITLGIGLLAAGALLWWRRRQYRRAR